MIEPFLVIPENDVYDYGQLICQDLVTALNAHTFLQQFETTAPEDPHTELNLDGTGEPHKDIRAFVIPVNQIEERGDRGGHVAVRNTINLFLSLYLQPITEDYQISRKIMGNQLAEIRHFLRFKEMAGWTWESTETITPYDIDKLRIQFRYLGVLGITYWNPE